MNLTRGLTVGVEGLAILASAWLALPVAAAPSGAPAAPVATTWPADPPAESPLIKSLLLEAKRRGAAAIDAFVKDLRTPIYETVPGNKDLTLVTFFWRGEAAVVAVVADFADSARSQRMFRIEGTDCWYRTYCLPGESRFYYRIAHDDKLPDAANEATWLYDDVVAHGDPLNPRGITIGADRRFSFAELPGAPALPEYAKHDDREHGTFEPSRKSAFQLSPTNLGKHKVWLYKPPRFDPAKPCNLIVFLDGSGRFQLIDSVTMLDNLIAEKKIGQTVGLFTDSPDRDRDLACSETYLNFLVEEVIPWVAKRYCVRFEPSRTIINGASLGGLFAGYAVLKRPDVFAGALMQSPTLWWHPAGQPPEWLARHFGGTSNVRGRFFVAPGIFERTAADPQAEGILFCSRRFTDLLGAKHGAAKLREVPGGHDPFCWQTSLPEGVVWLLAK